MNEPTAAEHSAAERWVQENLLCPECLPYSFRLAGKPFAAFVSRSVFLTERREEPDETRFVTSLQDSQTGLTCRCEISLNRAYPVIQWTVWLQQEGPGDSPEISDFYGADALLFPCAIGDYLHPGAATLHHFKGDYNRADGYMPQTETLYRGQALTYRCYEGRPTNGSFPYYRLDDGQRSLILAVSWQGQWETCFEPRYEGCWVRARQQHLRTYLRPGESIRAPRILILPLEGADPVRAQNLWRRWFIRYHMPRPQGQPPAPFMACYAGVMYQEMTLADEEKLIAYADRFLDHGIPFDYLWVDAGWYDMNGTGAWPSTGTWKPDYARFPRGLRGLSDAMRQRGVRMMVWFDPERVAKGSELHREHPEWCLASRANTFPEAPTHSALDESLLLNLANPDAVRWISDRVSSLIQSEGIDLYRQDYNIDPLTYWLENDEPGREGYLENRYCIGYLAFWDRLLAANPGLLIDSCASGGRRNDLETLARAVPLHVTDYNYGDLTAKQGMAHTLYQWFPVFGSMDWPYEGGDTYSHRSALRPTYHVADNVLDPAFDFAAFRGWAEEWRQTAPCQYGDFYPLTPYSIDPRCWIGWELYEPEAGQGLALFFLREEAPYSHAAFPLQGLEPTARYEVRGEDGAAAIRTGADLMARGLEVAQRRRPDSALFRFCRLP